MIELIEIKPPDTNPQEADQEIIKPIPIAEEKKHKEITEYPPRRSGP
jgi:hypothetical protein